MATITNKHFDILEFVKKSKELGVDERVAELQARQIEQIVEAVQEQQIEIDALKSKEPATKGDLFEIKQEIKQIELKIEQTRTEIQKSKYEVVIWVAGLLVASGLIQHFFK